jgi:signal transduction histidine kinase/CheY-like chemotaxis protein
MDRQIQIEKAHTAQDTDARAAVTDAIQSLDFGLVLWDEDLGFVFGNKYWQETFFPDRMPQPGESAVELLRDLVKDGTFILPDGMPPEGFADQIVELIRTYATDVRIDLANGRVLNSSVHKTGLGGYLISFRDISPEIRATEDAEQQRSKTERANTRLRDALDSIGEGFALFDKDDRLILANDLYKSANPASAHLMTFGRPRKEIIEAMTHGGDIVGVQDWIDSYDRETVAGDTASPRRYEVHHADGRVFMASRGRTAEGGCTITWLDITDSKKTEERARAVAHDAMEALDEGFALFDADLRFVFCNRMFADIVLGGQEYTPERGALFADHMGAFYERKLSVDANTTPRHQYLEDARAFVTGYEKRAEFGFLDGRILLMSSHQTDLGGYLITARDVTEQRAIETERRRAAERELEVVTDTMQSLITAIALFDADLNFVMGNRGYFDMWYHKAGIAPAAPGESLTSILDRLLDVDYFVLPDGVDRGLAHTMMLQSVETHSKNVPLETRTGSYLGHVSPAGNGGYLVEFSDQTEQKALEEERRLTESRALARVTDTVEALDIALVLLDRDLKFVFGNQMLNDFFHRDIPRSEVGEPIETSARRLVEGGFYHIPEGYSEEEVIARVLSRVRNIEKNFETLAADGRVFRGSVHRTEDDGRVISFTDITNQRRAESELERQRELTHQNEKLSAMGELLAGVAHELNNPLSIVVGYAMMMQNAELDPKQKRQVDNIAQAAERCSRIVKAFLAMARQRPAELKRCSLNELLTAALDMIGHRLRGSDIDVTLDLDPRLPDVDADEDQIIQVLTNLIVNAEQALIDQDGPRKLHLRSYHDTATGQAVVRVADNGPGIPPLVQSRIFEPFFTTKEVGTGTGIGLAFSHRIITAHGGRMKVRSDPGKGARFYIRLDAATSARNVPSETEPVEDGFSGRVLVVDDESGVAELIGDILIEAGYQVEIYNNAADALELLRTQWFDAVVSDIKMPGMDGPAFHEALSAIDPAIAHCTGFVTGDTLSGDVASFLSKTDQPHLEKPVTPLELLDLVGGLIERRRS